MHGGVYFESMNVVQQTTPKAHIRNGVLTITLTDEIRKKLDVHEGDELEAHVFNGSVSFTLKGSDAREQAWQRIFSVIDRVRVRPGKTPMSEEEIVEAVKETRRSLRKQKSMVGGM